MNNTTPPLSATSENLASRVIDFVRFPLIVLVVTIHISFKEFVSDGTLQNFPGAIFFNDLIAQGIARVAVPLFLFISGYLFFLNASAFNREIYFKKLKRRFWTLCVPLAIWGTAFFLSEFLAWEFGSQLFRDQRTFNNFSATTFFREFLIYGVSAKDLVPFWFVRDLVFMCLTSPLWFFLMKKLKFPLLILLGACLCFHIYPSEFVSNFLFVVFFFCFGAYFSIHEIDFTKVFSKVRVPLFICYPLLLVGDATLHFFGFVEFYSKIKNFGIVVGLATTVAFVSILLEKRPNLRLPKTLRDSTFFVYAGHFFLVCLPLVLSPCLFPCETNLGIIMAFLYTFVFATTVCILLSILFRKFAPWSIRFLTGGR